MKVTITEPGNGRHRRMWSVHTEGGNHVADFIAVGKDGHFSVCTCQDALFHYPEEMRFDTTQRFSWEEVVERIKSACLNDPTFNEQRLAYEQSKQIVAIEQALTDAFPWDK